MNLKCTGGHCDGQIQYVEDKSRLNDTVRVYEPLKFAVRDIDTDFQEGLQAFRENRRPESLTAKYHIYRICAIHGTSINGDRQTLKYLCPHDWHEWEAILHQFGK